MKIVVIFYHLPSFLVLLMQKNCTERDAEAADIAVDNLDSWDALHKNHIAYAQCDDGSIAKGNSVAMARRLTDKWQEIAKLQSLINRDSGFENIL